MEWPDERRERLLSALDHAESFVVLIYRAILGAIAVAIITVVGFVVIKRP